MNIAPWHQICTLREEVRTGTLTLAEFAADLYGVRTGDAPEVYRDADKFFARTSPTHRMKELVRDVLQRLAGTGGNPVLRLQVAYGGGKTHSLITLLHLAERAQSLATNPTANEFLTFAGVEPIPSARVALLPFDKFDIHDGLEVFGPDGSRWRVMTPWGALAYQLAGDAGYARVKPHEDSYSTPAQPILEELLKAPNSEGKGALVLVDEAVIYGRAAVNLDERRLGILKDFFQLLTQAVAATNRACIVATLIASENEAEDATGARVLHVLEDVFGRLQTTIEPVGRDDVAEVLRRRLFESVPGEAERRPVVDAMLATYAGCPKLREAQKNQTAYDRLLRSYPFHPDLLEVFYEKWTGLPRFQRTRGALRLLALAMQEGVGKDPAPFVGVSSLLGHDVALSPPVTDMVRICSDSNDMWTPKLVGELERAREVQTKLPSLSQREIEQAVLAVFLHSQPPGRRAETSDLYALLLHPGVDQAALETGLKNWRDLSWFLMEETNFWRITTEPNLTHIHVQAMQRLGDARIADEMRAQIEKVGELTATDRDGTDRGVRVHRLPQSPRDVEDNTDLHYLVLGPECALDLAQPISAQVTAFFATTSGPQNPRTFRNTLVALAPDSARVAGLRRGVMELLGWQTVEASEIGKQLTDTQKRALVERKRAAETNLPSAVRATYSAVLDMGEDGNVRAQSLKSADALNIRDTRPFARLKAMLASEERLITGDLLPELLLPDSYYELWAPGETSKSARALLAAFAQFPRLPRFLSAAIFYSALQRGCEEGALVLRLPRPDGTARTFWRVGPTQEELTRTELEVLIPAAAELTDMDAALLAPSALPGLWKSASEPIVWRDVIAYFDGQKTPHVQPSALLSALSQAVQLGIVLARTPERSYLKELLPSEAVTDSLELLAPPAPVQAEDLLPDALSGVWEDKQAFLESLWHALSQARGHAVPWPMLCEGVTAGLGKRLFEVSQGSIWPCVAEKAGQVVLTLGTKQTIKEPPRLPLPGQLTAEGTLSTFELMKLGERVQELSAAAPTLTFGFHVLITANGDDATADIAAELNAILAELTSKLKFGE
jgi:hypothetical protein